MLPDTSTRLSAGEPSRPPKPAYLVRFPEEVWSQLEQNPSGLSISFDDGIHLDIPGTGSISLNSQASGITSEIHSLNKDLLSSHILTPHSVASTRLCVPPTTSASGSRAADRLKAQTEAIEQEKKARTDRLNGKKTAHSPATAAATLGLRNESLSMARTNSAPPTSAGNATAGSSGPVIPLKTRVVQLLALGPLSVNEIVKRVGMTEQEVMRVVKVVGRETSDGCYTLQPSKYNQVKIGPWRYTYAEKMLVIRLARGAYDELGLPPDAEERAELEKKEAEVISGVSSNGSVSDSAPLPQPSIPTPTPAPAPASVAVSPPKEKKESVPKEKKEKNASGGSSAKKGLGLIGKQKAKFAAEKRASSLPNARKPDGTASPRANTPVIVDAPVKADATRTTTVKRKRDEGEGVSRKKAGSPVSTQSNKSSEDTRGRQRERETVKKDPKPNGTSQSDKGKERRHSKSKNTSSREYSSSESETDEPIRQQKEKEKKDKHVTSTSISNPTVPPPSTAISNHVEESLATSTSTTSTRTFKRKAPPPELKLNGHRQSPPPAPPPDPEALRERYEELYPAYQLLTRKLATLHKEAEGEEEGEVVEMDEKELSKMVKRWEKWHTELEGIRRWFGET